MRRLDRFLRGGIAGVCTGRPEQGGLITMEDPGKMGKPRGEGTTHALVKKTIQGIESA